MKEKELLKGYFKEMPEAKVSSDFTKRMMDQIRQEPVYVPKPYADLIGRKGWITIGLLLVAFVVSLILARFWFPANDPSTAGQFVQQIDLSFVNKGITFLLQLLSKVPLTVVTGMLAFLALLLFDLFHSKLQHHRA
ncbi:MAG: hypothetical protein LWW85_15900 [Marinilabiliales bacterium]|nr:hypothetical protein [Marinilabiliales bacterium]